MKTRILFPFICALLSFSFIDVTNNNYELIDADGNTVIAPQKSEDDFYIRSLILGPMSSLDSQNIDLSIHFGKYISGYPFLIRALIINDNVTSGVAFERYFNPKMPSSRIINFTFDIKKGNVIDNAYTELRIILGIIENETIFLDRRIHISKPAEDAFILNSKSPSNFTNHKVVKGVFNDKVFFFNENIDTSEFNVVFNKTDLRIDLSSLRFEINSLKHFDPTVCKGEVDIIGPDEIFEGSNFSFQKTFHIEGFLVDNELRFRFKDVFYVNPLTLEMSFDYLEGFKETNYIYIPRNSSFESDMISMNFRIENVGWNHVDLEFQSRHLFWSSSLGERNSAEFYIETIFNHD